MQDLSAYPRRRRARRAKRAFVTGGAGFVGSHLAEALLARGYRVTVLDNLSTGRLANVEHLLGERRFELVVDDVTNTTLLDEVAGTSDVIFHLAAAVGVKLILADPRGSIETNVSGTMNVLEAALKGGAKVLVASTSEVYGKPSHVPQREDDDVVLGPTRIDRWSYAAAKMLDEFIALAYHRETGLPVVLFRLFNTVGPRQTGTYGMVIPRFVEAALRGEALPVYGDGRQLRCFLHVRDAVAAIVRLAECPVAVGEVVNVGSVEPVTIAELAARVLHHLDGQAHQPLVSFVPYEQAFPGGGFEDIPRRVPDISKIRALTGWQPTHTLDDILADVISEYAESEAAELALAHAT
jgi:UDP-glucose 4-epimerase